MSLLNTVARPSTKAGSCWPRRPTRAAGLRSPAGFIRCQVRTARAALTTPAVLVYTSTLPEKIKGSGVTHLSPGFWGLIVMHLWYDLKLRQFSRCLSIDVKDFCFRFINSTIDCIEVTWHMTISTSENAPELGT